VVSTLAQAEYEDSYGNNTCLKTPQRWFFREEAEAVPMESEVFCRSEVYALYLLGLNGSPYSLCRSLYQMRSNKEFVGLIIQFFQGQFIEKSAGVCILSLFHDPKVIC